MTTDDLLFAAALILAAACIWWTVRDKIREQNDDTVACDCGCYDLVPDHNVPSDTATPLYDQLADRRAGFDRTADEIRGLPEWGEGA